MAAALGGATMTKATPIKAACRASRHACAVVSAEIPATTGAWPAVLATHSRTDMRSSSVKYLASPAKPKAAIPCAPLFNTCFVSFSTSPKATFAFESNGVGSIGNTPLNSLFIIFISFFHDLEVLKYEH
jgi:hypothetical protein